MKERKLGLLGKKIGMTRVFNEAGESMGVTVIQLGPCVVLDKITKDKAGRQQQGYTALKLGFDPKEERKLNKPETGALKGAGGAGKATWLVREVRVTDETLAKFQVGQDISLKDLGWQSGQLVDIVGTSKGKGFQGVIKRHHFGGFPATHGTHEYFRHGGSIGNRKWPGRTFKGRRMPGHMGDERVTLQNITVVQVREEDNVILVNGSVPGAKNGYVLVRPAIKTNPQG